MRFQSSVIVAAASMLAAAGAAGQSLSKVSVVYLLTPRPHVTVTNNDPSPLTGMVITVRSSVAPYRRTEIIWFDSGTYFWSDPPLPTGQSRTFPVGPLAEASNLRPRLRAVAFQDSTSAGDPHWLAEVDARRKAAYAEIGSVTALLNQGLAQAQSNQQILSSLKAAEWTMFASTPDVNAKTAAEFGIDVTETNLKRARVGDAVGDPQKTIPAIILPLFSRWRAALKRFDRNIR